MSENMAVSTAGNIQRFVPSGWRVNDVQCWRGQQGLKCTVYAWRNAEAVQVHVNRDAYDRQSTAHVSVWREHGWVEVYRRHAIETLPIAAFSYVSRNEAEWVAAMAASVVELLGAASRVGVLS